MRLLQNIRNFILKNTIEKVKHTSKYNLNFLKCLIFFIYKFINYVEGCYFYIILGAIARHCPNTTNIKQEADFIFNNLINDLRILVIIKYTTILKNLD